MAAKIPFTGRQVGIICLLCLAMVLGGLLWRNALTTGDLAADLPLKRPAQLLPTLHHPFLELLKLISAFLIGLTVTFVHRTTSPKTSMSAAMQQAQVLLCVSGALMMIIIGDSLARAFGIAGAASIIRFRTPVENPKDTIILFLSLGLGMACGLGAFAVAGLGTLFLGGALWYLSTTARTRRQMTVVLSAEGEEFPTTFVQEIFTRHGVEYETHGLSHGGAAPEIRYRVIMDSELSLDVLSDELRNSAGSPIRSVTWEKIRKKDQAHH